MSDLEHLVSLADMMGGHVKMRRVDRAWIVLALADGPVGRPLAHAQAPTITAAVLACLAKPRMRETTNDPA